jgi:hypothetical protein
MPRRYEVDPQGPFYLADSDFSGITPYAIVSAESGVTIVNYAYPPGHVYRYGTNTTPGTTNMTTAINTAAAVCLAGGYTLQLPAESCLVSSSINCSGIRMEGPTADMQGQIQASSAQFDVITSTGSSSFANFRVNGGWDAVTAGQSGDIFSFTNGSGFAYNIHLHNITAQKAKKRLVYWHNGGYGSIWNFHGNSAGLHGIELEGHDIVNSCTTIRVGGSSIFSDCVNGYSAKITYGISICFNGCIMENSNGIEINGDNRTLSFNDVYQENTTGGLGTNFITFTGPPSGIGLSVTNCFGGNKSIAYPTNFQNVYYSGNSNLSESAVPYANRVVIADGGQIVSAVTGGISVTATSASLAPGTWMIQACLQVANAGALNMSDAGIVITTDVTNAGASSSTSTFEEGADRVDSPSTGLDSVRLNAFKMYQNTTTAAVTMYLRSRLTFSAGSCAYRGYITATKLQ